MMHKVRKLSIRVKVILVFIITTLIILLINLFMYVNVNRMLNRLEEIYMSNISLNELSDTLVDVQASMTAYLNTRTSDALEDYYRNEQDYSQLIFRLNGGIYGNDLKLMEKNIKNMSEEYLELTGQTVDAKRGGNVEKVKARYEKATELQGYLKTYIYSLNNEQFRVNSSSYQVLSTSLKYLEWINVITLILVGVCNIVLIVMLTSTITRPLQRLAGTADQVAKGNMEVELLPVIYEDEVGVVSKAFNAMVVSIKEYIDRVRKSMETENALKEKERENHTTLRLFIRAVVVPEMQIKLKQGFGRAIRTETDTCVVAILDERAAKGKRYSKDVLAALPEMPVTGSLGDVARFIRQVKGPDYFREASA